MHPAQRSQYLSRALLRSGPHPVFGTVPAGTSPRARVHLPRLFLARPLREHPLPGQRLRPRVLPRRPRDAGAARRADRRRPGPLRQQRHRRLQLARPRRGDGQLVRTPAGSPGVVLTSRHGRRAGVGRPPRRRSACSSSSSTGSVSRSGLAPTASPTAWRSTSCTSPGDVGDRTSPGRRDDRPDRARRRPARRAEEVRFGEPYRTLLGHLRHEIGHYYWTILIERAGRTEAFRRHCSATSGSTTPPPWRRTTNGSAPVGRPEPTSATTPPRTRGRTGPRRSPTTSTSATPSRPRRPTGWSSRARTAPRHPRTPRWRRCRASSRRPSRRSSRPGCR